MVLTKEDLTEAIREGLNKSTEDTAREILKGLIFVLIIVGLFFLWNTLHEARYPEENLSLPQPSCFPLQNLYCKILTYESCDNEIKVIPNKEITGSKCTRPNILYEKYLCGYMEANAWFEMIKQQTKNFNLVLECE